MQGCLLVGVANPQQCRLIPRLCQEVQPGRQACKRKTDEVSHDDAWQAHAAIPSSNFLGTICASPGSTACCWVHVQRPKIASDAAPEAALTLAVEPHGDSEGGSASVRRNVGTVIPVLNCKAPCHTKHPTARLEFNHFNTLGCRG
jgi:hypothetical protein